MDPWDDWVYFLTFYHIDPSKNVGKYISPHGIFFIKLCEFSVVKLILGFFVHKHIIVTTWNDTWILWGYSYINPCKLVHKAHK